MIEYRVRSISLLTLVNEVQAGRLVPDAYFQRDLVWRDIHKKDFIKTILLGYPFPQIFISKGKIDVETMSTISCIVDGQQRTNAIIDFIAGKFDVEGRFFSDLSGVEKSEFLKYEIAVIELDLENDDPKVKEIFQRINRTSNSLSSIEKASTEYSTSEYMLVAKLLSNEIIFPDEVNNDFQIDPNIPEDFFIWAKKQKIKQFQQLITDRGVFTPRELSRKTHLLHVLNMMSTILGTFFNRNEKTNEYLNDYAIVFPEKDRVVSLFEETAQVILKLKLKSRSYWYNKANIFSLIVGVANFLEKGEKLDLMKLKENLSSFEGDIPDDYRLAAAEGVNSTKARTLRNEYVVQLIQKSRI